MLMKTMVVVMLMAPRHRFGIEHARLLEAQLGIESLDRPGPLRDPGAAHVRHRLHPV